MTAIEWTDETWNPMLGCTRVSPGCGRADGGGCYAEGEAVRVNRCSKALGRVEPYADLVKLVKRGDRTEARWTGKVRFAPERLAKPLGWRKPRRVFVNSMSDLFHDGFTDEQIAAVFGVMASTPRHTFQILTKRPERMRAWFERAIWPWIACCADDALIAAGVERPQRFAIDRAIGTVPRWPLPNVWIGVTCENREHGVPRIDVLRDVPAAVRFLSIEPILEDVGALDLRGIGWVIAGCESGDRARVADVEWFRSIRDQCVAAGVAFFLKQATNVPACIPAPAGLVTSSGWIDVVDEGPGSHRKPGGGGIIGAPYLDGVQHLAFPEPGAWLAGRA